MMANEVHNRVEAKVLGLEITLECEEGVVAHLQHYREEWDAHKDDREYKRTDRQIRGMRQLLDSEKTCRDLRQEIEDLRVLTGGAS